MHVEVRGRRHFEFDVELCIPSGRRMELDARIVAANLEVDLRILHMTLTARLDRVSQVDLVGLAAHDTQVAHAQPHMQHAASYEVSNVSMGFFIVPVVRRGTERNQQEAEEKRILEPSETGKRSSDHGAPSEAYKCLMVIRRRWEEGSVVVPRGQGLP